MKILYSKGLDLHSEETAREINLADRFRRYNRRPCDAAKTTAFQIDLRWMKRKKKSYITTRWKSDYFRRNNLRKNKEIGVSGQNKKSEINRLHSIVERKIWNTASNIGVHSNEFFHDRASIPADPVDLWTCRFLNREPERIADRIESAQFGARAHCERYRELDHVLGAPSGVQLPPEMASPARPSRTIPWNSTSFALPMEIWVFRKRGNGVCLLRENSAKL